MMRWQSKLLGVAMATLPLLGCEPREVDHVAEVTTVLEALPVAWNARDASMWVANFASSSDFTNILGMHFDDRAANEARHATLFESIFSNSTLEAEVLDVRILGDDAAVAEVAFRLVGYERLPPGVIETEPGELRTRLITVLERREGRWQIVAAQNTAILPFAAAPPGA
jgi:uncharacterized protein (TIGR02246 family)